MAEKVKLADLETYVYIDVSNIRSACLKTLDLMIDFAKLLEYFRQKYPNLKDVRYYEGIAKGDVKKQRMFDFLRQKGYVICPLERKSYNSSEIEKCEVKCPKCKHKWASRVYTHAPGNEVKCRCLSGDGAINCSASGKLVDAYYSSVV